MDSVHRKSPNVRQGFSMQTPLTPRCLCTSRHKGLTLTHDASPDSMGRVHVWRADYLILGKLTNSAPESLHWGLRLVVGTRVPFPAALLRNFLPGSPWAGEGMTSASKNTPFPGGTTLGTEQPAVYRKPALLCHLARETSGCWDLLCSSSLP